MGLLVQPSPVSLPAQNNPALPRVPSLFHPERKINQLIGPRGGAHDRGRTRLGMVKEAGRAGIKKQLKILKDRDTEGWMGQAPGQM